MQCWYNGFVLNLLRDTDKNNGQELEKAEHNIKQPEVALIVEAEMNIGKIQNPWAIHFPLLLACLQWDAFWLNTVRGCEVWRSGEAAVEASLCQPGTKHWPTSQEPVFWRSSRQDCSKTCIIASKNPVLDHRFLNCKSLLKKVWWRICYWESCSSFQTKQLMAQNTNSFYLLLGT